MRGEIVELFLRREVSTITLGYNDVIVHSNKNVLETYA
jgi:hypothetical protein